MIASLLVALVLIAPAAARASLSPLDGRAMWIWYLDRSAGGNVAAIAAQAHIAGVNTVIVKSADGPVRWRQFSRRLVKELRADGLDVCAWQYVYGSDPIGEARMGALAARVGAQCLVIDAEAEYEGRYAAAQTYLAYLRRAVGARYPIGLASFPYADYHPAFPYSVFLGPGGAQFDLPQMYWQLIGGSLAGVFHHTYTTNRIYRRPIRPLGATFGSPSAFDVELFRSLTVRYGASGISWWDFAWTSTEGLWLALRDPLAATGTVQALGYPRLGEGARGDEVLWLQEHLASEFPSQRITGLFGAQTRGHLDAFQARHHEPVTGHTDPYTWFALLKTRPVTVAWTGEGASIARVGGRAPASARLRASKSEIPEIGAQRVSTTAVDPS